MSFIGVFGCIGLYRDGKTFKLKLVIGSTSVDWLRNLRAIWNDAGYFLICKKKSEKRKAVAQWVTYNINAQNILKDVLPFLGIKKAQAELALDFKPNEVVRDSVTGRFTFKGENLYESHKVMAAELMYMKTEQYIPQESNPTLMPDGSGRM